MFDYWRATTHHFLLSNPSSRLRICQIGPSIFPKALPEAEQRLLLGTRVLCDKDRHGTTDCERVWWRKIGKTGSTWKHHFYHRIQWEFQDPKTEVRWYHMMFGDILRYIPLYKPYMGLIYGRYLQFRFLKWPLKDCRL